MTHAESKAKRLLQIETMLMTHHDGLTQAEIARRLGVNRSTVNRYIPDLPGYIYIDDLDYGKWKIDLSADLIHVHLNLHEALALHLATRLLATRSDRHNPHAAAALRKLGLSVLRCAPRISLHMARSADMMDEVGQRHDPVFLQSLEKLTLAWAEQRKAQVWHRSERTGKVSEYIFAPYFIEPYAVGLTTHVIGRSDGDEPGNLRTLKIERIERVEPTRTSYTIPSDFDPLAILEDAWGIWYTEQAPVCVVLKFHPRVVRRVQETRWHRSEEETELPDGSLLWKARVAEPKEMLPWIRGWGADVEVLEPEGLREAVREDVKRLAEVYG